MFPGVNSANGFLSIKPAETAFSHSAFSSSAEPMHLRSVLSSVDQIGNGMPQKRERDKFQS